MKQLNLSAMALATAAIMGMSSLNAGTFNANSVSNTGNPFARDYHGRQYRGQKPFSVKNLEERISQKENNGPFKKAVKDPIDSFSNIPVFEYLNGPDGSLWYYTAEFESEKIVHNEYWTEEVLHAFTFTIYDDSFNEVGKISDTIELGKDYTGSVETRAREIILDPTISVNFFNTDDKYEVMVLHVINTERYVNHYYNKVYSIGGEKDSDGYDKSIATFEGRCLEAINYNDGSGKENFIYSFVADPDITFPKDDPNYLEKLHALNFDVTVYKKATENEGPTCIFNKGVGATRVPGDTTDGIYYLSKQDNGKIYLTFSNYEKPFFIDPRGGAEEEGTTPDNSLVIEVYSITGETTELVSTTKIPVKEFMVDGMLTYTYYSIGSLAWTNDIDMKVHGSYEKPAFIVNKTVVNAATLEDILYNSYDIYGNDGQHVKNIGEMIEGMAVYDMPDGSQPQALFVKMNQEGKYQFEFTNLYDGKVVMIIDQENEGDEIRAPASIVLDREGKLKYVFEMKYYLEDDDYNMLMRVAWYNADGSLDHIDNVNMGQDVQYATVNLDPVGLKPNLYDTDDAMEYAVLAKRTYGATTRNEYMVVDDNGERYATFTADDGRGDPFLFTILPGNPNRIMMTYQSSDGLLNIDFYGLPFIGSGIDRVENSIEAGATSISFDGSTVFAPEASIEIYNVGGIKEAEGKNSVSVENLSSGVYVIVATDINGKQTAVKIKK